MAEPRIHYGPTSRAALGSFDADSPERPCQSSPQRSIGGSVERLGDGCDGGPKPSTHSSKYYPQNLDTSRNIDEWAWKLNALLSNDDEREILTRDKRDRRDYEELASLATRMGLYSRQYAKVVVFSKTSLPSYRYDLDDSKPQRQEVNLMLGQYLVKIKKCRETFPNITFSVPRNSDSCNKDEALSEQASKSLLNVVSEKVLWQRSTQLRERQHAWQESSEGQRMQEFRRDLPIYKARDSILAAISRSQVVVISGETGCGKTTQLPQYILESEIAAGRGSACFIICTQPRRLSAMSVSERVSTERGEKLGESVGYKVRLEGVKGRDTRLLFCTSGILLRRLRVDKKLTAVSHVIIDEIHERGMNEDFLLIVLKDVLRHRPELRLVLMSATLNAELFSSYFGLAPVIYISGFTFPVQTYFLEEILEITGYRLTTKNQIDDYGQEKSWKMQKQSYRKKKSRIAFVVEDALKYTDFSEYDSKTRESLSCWEPDSIGFNLIESVLVYICQTKMPGAVLVFMMGWDDINYFKDQLQGHALLGDPTKALVLTCHGSMASSEQKQIFDEPVSGVRKIVLATNVAETSITINDVVFVVDCGKLKETSYDALNNTPCLLPSWISKASAQQRRGRAGRVQPGECYHLYPKCVYNIFEEYQLPELLRTPLQSLCLQIKSLRFGCISKFLSRALQPPEPLSVQNAIEYLKIIGALNENEDLTILGCLLSTLPVEPKLGKMLVFGAIFCCLDPILTVVACLSVRDPFLMPFDKKDMSESAKFQFSCEDYSDHLVLVRAYEGWKEAERNQSEYEYCWKNFLSVQTLKAIDSIRNQFLNLLEDAGLFGSNCYPGTCHMHNNESLVRAIICAGLYPGVCSVLNKEKSTLLKTREDGQVILCSNSVNAREAQIPYPWLVFNEKVKVNSVFIRDSTAISDSVLLLFGGDISRGETGGKLNMLGGYLEFFMASDVAEMYLNLKRELKELIQQKLMNPKMDIQAGEKLLSAVQLLLNEDNCNGSFVCGYQQPVSILRGVSLPQGNGAGGENSKNHLQSLLVKAGHDYPTYTTKQVKNEFRATVEFSGLQFVGRLYSNKKFAEKDAAVQALEWLIGGVPSGVRGIDWLPVSLKKSKREHLESA